MDVIEVGALLETTEEDGQQEVRNPAPRTARSGAHTAAARPGETHLPHGWHSLDRGPGMGGEGSAPAPLKAARRPWANTAARSRSSRFLACGDSGSAESVLWRRPRGRAGGGRSTEDGYRLMQPDSESRHPPCSLAGTVVGVEVKGRRAVDKAVVRPFASRDAAQPDRDLKAWPDSASARCWRRRD